MSYKLPKLTIEKQEVAFTSNRIVHDIVHFIDSRDVERYIYNKFIGELDTAMLAAQRNSELQMFLNELKGQGYEITNIGKIEANARKLAEIDYKQRLKKETAKLRHEVSALAKKINKLENIDKEELHNIGQCLLDCIESHKFEGGFDHEYSLNEKQWSYNKDRYLFELVCDLFDLDKAYELDNHGY